jgi:hypothetical protein
MLKYASLGFDSEDTQNKYAIVYNDHADCSGDCDIEWFDTDILRAKKVEQDINNGVVFLSEWRPTNA